MNIVVNTRLMLKQRLEGIGYFEQEVFLRIAALHPEHKFYFLFDRPCDAGLEFPVNAEPIIAGPPTRHPLLWKFWFDIRVPRLLKKLKADLFVSPDGFLSLTTAVPQCLVVHDLGFLDQPDAYKTSHRSYLKYYTRKFVKKAARIATVSAFSADDLVKHYHVNPEKIDVVYSGVKNIFRPLDQTEKDRIREKWTTGKEYFIYAGAIQPRKNLVNLLKAFSIFKKRQQSNWKLVLAGRLAWKNDEFLQLLKTYKFRDDVIMTGYVEEKDLADLVAASYALIYPSFFEGFGVPVLEAMNCDIPALTTMRSSMEEIAEDAALYFDPADPADIADKMMLIYKDEDLRNRLVQKGKVVRENFSWDKTAALMWDCMMRAAND